MMKCIESEAKKSIPQFPPMHEIIVLLRNTLLVTLTVALGFTLCSAIGIPRWLQIICLIPAGYLFIRLSGQPVPPLRRWGSYALALSAVLSLFAFASGIIRAHFSSFHESSWPAIMIFSIIFLPTSWLASVIQRHWPFGGSEASSEPDGE